MFIHCNVNSSECVLDNKTDFKEHLLPQIGIYPTEWTKICEHMVNRFTSICVDKQNVNNNVFCFNQWCP